MADDEDLKWDVGARALRKLDDAEAAVRTMREARDFQTYRRAFGSALSDIRSALWHLESDLKNVVRRRQRRHLREPAFAWWAEVKKKETDDDLLSWAQSMRDDDIHGGRGQAAQPLLQSVSYTSGYLSSQDLMPAPVEGAALLVGTEGAQWAINVGQEDERRWPARPRPGTLTDQSVNKHEMYMSKVPQTYLGAPIPDPSPDNYCELVIKHWEWVVREAMRRWGAAEG